MFATCVCYLHFLLIFVIRVCSVVGVVKFVGILDENTSAPDTYVGVKTDDNSKSFTHNIPSAYTIV